LTLVRNTLNINVVIIRSISIPVFISIGISVPAAIENRNTAFSRTRNPTMCEKIRLCVIISNNPQSIALMDIIRKEGVIAGSLNINDIPILTKNANIVSIS
jgi:hypothetical protein